MAPAGRTGGTVSLVGLPGSGKSTIGRLLARDRGQRFVDSDHEIERRIGGTIRAFFDREGEAAFREIEAEVIRELCAGPAIVLATGGGAVLRAENRAALRAAGRVIYLRAHPEDLARRLSRDTQRPLLQNVDPRVRLRELYAVRDPLYLEAADHVIETARKSVHMLVQLAAMQLDLASSDAPAPSGRADAAPILSASTGPIPVSSEPIPTPAAHVAARVQIDLGDRSYPIVIGSGLLADAGGAHWDIAANRGAHAWVVTNTTVGPLYADALVAALAPRFRGVNVLTLPDGEVHKDWVNLNQVFDALLGAAADRKTVLFALGGGVIGDLTGFAAACYMRGVPFVQVPTTLLAQVDSSVGGKTAINHPAGKNMIGAFYQPQAVICDLDALRTLPARELSAGLAEVIKYGAIIDADFFGWLEQHLDALRSGDRDALATAVQRCCELKAQVVGADERESGLRAILNFGHTFGHAIEAGMGYGAWLHGEAVGCGMVMAAETSARLGLIDAAVARRIEALIARAGLPVRGPSGLSAARYLDLMRHDKKAEQGGIRYVLLNALGRAETRAAPDALVAEVVAALTERA